MSRSVLHLFRLALVCAALAAAAAAAQNPQPPKSQMPTLGRPTKPTDETPLFNFDEYFNGKWTFSWDVPDGVLGSAGTITGTAVSLTVGGKIYQAATEVNRPGGAFTSS